MEIKGKVHCFFEQSGTFKNEFIKLGYEAEDYDIQNNFCETDNVVDLFAEIEKCYGGGQSVFDTIKKDDLVMAFFPCIYFESLSMMAFNWGYTNYRKLNDVQKTQKIIERADKRHEFYMYLLKLVYVVTKKELRMIVENPYAMQHYLKQGNFIKPPAFVDEDRTRRGDFFIKPTAYWYFGCEPTFGFTHQQTDKSKIRNVIGGAQLGKVGRGSKESGICSEDRSMISPDYARNFICDFILGKEQRNAFNQLQLNFEE